MADWGVVGLMPRGYSGYDFGWGVVCWLGGRKIFRPYSTSTNRFSQAQATASERVRTLGSLR